MTKSGGGEGLYEQWRLIGKGKGIHWEAVDEDLSVSALLAPVAEPTESKEN